MVDLGVQCAVYVLVSAVCYHPLAAPLGFVRGVWAVVKVPEVAITLFTLTGLERPLEHVAEFCGVCWANGSWLLRHGSRAAKFLVGLSLLARAPNGLDWIG
jgi:hypothetical protein